jgi:dihydrofolate synthase / folylpolyglutamate synthase
MAFTAKQELIELLKDDHDFRKINLSLDNIKKALAIFSNPQDDFESVIVAGTNGKGSVCTYLEQLCLKYTDLKVAKFTSPHLISVTERIKLQNNEIPEARFVELLNEIKEKISFELTYFEKLSLVAFVYFSREKVDIAIIEVGIGGRLDCANVISAEKRKATSITSIGLDHVHFLGDTVEKIRKEKEAIKRKTVPHFDYQDYDFPGSIQEKNYSLALEIFKKAIQKTDIEIDKEYIFKAYKTSYRARFEFFEKYDLLLDSAHNLDGAKVLNEYLKEEFKGKKIDFHLAFLDRNYRSFVRNLIEDIDVEKIFIYQLEDDRAAVSKIVLRDLKEDLAHIEIELADLQKPTKSENFKVYTGSIYFCGQVLKLIGN